MARELARRRGLRGVVMFADPVARRTFAGDVVFPGRVGLIYQAAPTLALGRGTLRTQHSLPDGRVLNARARALQKVRSDEVGTDCVERLLVVAGARTRRNRESGRDWLSHALVEAPVRRVRHPGCYRYGFPRDRRVHVAIRPGPYSCPCLACNHRRRVRLDPAGGTLARAGPAWTKPCDSSRSHVMASLLRTDLPAGWLVARLYAQIHAAADQVHAGRLEVSVAWNRKPVEAVHARTSSTRPGLSCFVPSAGPVRPLTRTARRCTSRAIQLSCSFSSAGSKVQP